ncbi:MULTISPECIES: ABC transporter ATP-binding protein [unclassified Meridianimarinicoccus]|uniref:ABC transporter ATP-binding protein n=1 Tax=unclassified Meridianimarinicoccus TaxID=2923344 RepID=UPI001865FDE0|nr:ABC transporter ATP-binding protein [Fluviibacterium sp. MJW13]
MKLRIFGKSSESDGKPFFTAQDRENIAWFWNSYLKKRTVWLFLVLGLILVQGLVYQQFLRLTESGLRVIFDQGAARDLYKVCALVFALFFVRGITSYVVPRTSTWLASGAVMELRRDLIEKLLVLDLSYFERSSPADIILRVVTQAQTLSRFVGQVTINAVRDAVMVIIVSSYLIYKAPVLFMTALIIAPVILFTLQFVSRRIKHVQRTAESALAAYMNTLEETVNGMRTVKISNQEEFEEARLQATNEKIRDLQVRVQAAQAIVLPAIDFASAFAYAMVIGLGGYMAISPNHDIDGAAIITFMLGLVMVFDPLRALAKFFTQLQQQLVQLDSVHSIMRQKPSIVDVPNATDDFDAAADIRLEKVTFGYTADQPLFKDLDLTFDGGKRTAIVGATGSGKTTVLSLLGRLYDIQDGAVMIGDHNVRDIRISTLRKSFSVVAQDIVIFNASIWENIKYVRPQSTDEEIWAAAEAAEIAKLIRDRGDTPLGPKGAQLSGGQKQRIAIARAFLRSAPILLLDEATSALDQRTEERIKGALNRLSQGKTTIIVAHRLSSVIDADKIYVLDQGRVVETGTHAELLALGGLYAGMYTTQKEGYR